MLTLDHLRIFHLYNGNIDIWARSGIKKEKEIMSDEYWFMIENFQNDLEMINNGIASKEFETKIIANLKKLADIETQEHLLKNQRPK